MEVLALYIHGDSATSVALLVLFAVCMLAKAAYKLSLHKLLQGHCEAKSAW
jgi:hypothetical protein